jgi:Type VI secretion system/phage-baseplate injector OB domain
MSASDIQDVASHVGEMGEPVFGKYRGTVTGTDDPEMRGRLRVKVPALMGDSELEWAMPCVPYGGAAKVGSYWIPPEGALVWVEFEQGNISFPIWSGTYWTGGVEPPAADAAILALQTPFGHRLVLDDTESSEKITLSHAAEGTPSLTLDEAGRVKMLDGAGAHVTLDADAGEVIIADANGNTITLKSGTVIVEDSNGQSVKLESSGATVKANSITLDASSISLGKGASEPVIKGQSFLQLFMTHTHPTGVGPSGPPIPQGEMTTLSTTVMTK